MEIYEFAEFRLDAEERALYRHGALVALAPKAFETLLVLVKNHHRVVSKDDLMKQIWRDTFVEENNLTQYVFALRRALGEKSGKIKFIETVPRRGYRFIADVREASNAATTRDLQTTAARGLQILEASNGTEAARRKACRETLPTISPSQMSQAKSKRYRAKLKRRKASARFSSRRSPTKMRSEIIARV